MLTATPEAFDHLVFRERDLDTAIKSGAIEWTGDRKAFHRLLALVPPAAKAAPASKGGPG